MKHTEKLSAFETTKGKYSHRKVVPFRLGQTELQEYLDFASGEPEEGESTSV